MNSNKTNNNNEHFGCIVGIYDTYGVVKSDIDNNEYYFRYESNQSKFNKNDKVIFLLNQ